MNIKELIQEMESQNKIWAGAYEYTLQNFIMSYDIYIKKLEVNSILKGDRESIANILTLFYELYKESVNV